MQGLKSSSAGDAWHQSALAPELQVSLAQLHVSALRKMSLHKELWSWTYVRDATTKVSTKYKQVS